MRYLIITPFFAPHIGGSQRYMEELYGRIVHINPSAKVDVLCYRTTNAPKKETYRGMTVYRVSSLPVLPGQFILANPLELLGTLVQLSKYKYDIVHANTRFFESSWWAWGYARLLGAKSILTDHVSSHPVHPNGFVTHMARVLDMTIVRWILHQYDFVTATNAKTLKFLTNTFKLTNVLLTYGGVDTKMYKPAVSSKIRRIPNVHKKFSSKHIIVTFAGRLIDTKGVMLFIKAIQQLIKMLPSNVYFVIAGSGSLDTKIDTVLSDRALSRRVYRTGPLKPIEMKKLLQSTNIFVHPSYHAEGFPNAILEAGAAGCFVIATDNAGTKEIIEHKITGFIIKQKDSLDLKHAIKWAVSHPRQINSIRKYCRKYIVANYDWGALVSEFLTLTQRFYLTPRTMDATPNTVLSPSQAN